MLRLPVALKATYSISPTDAGCIMRLITHQQRQHALHQLQHVVQEHQHVLRVVQYAALSSDACDALGCPSLRL
jgi:ribosomal protein L22